MARGFGTQEDDEQLDDQELDDVETEDEEEDDFSDLDDETRERLEKYQQRQSAKWQAELDRREEAVQGVGLGFNNKGQVLISDPSKFSSYASPFARSRHEAEQQQQRQQPIQQQEEEEEWVDPSYDAAAFQKQLSKHVAKETSKYEQAIIGLQNTIIEDRIEQAMEKVEGAVERHLPYLRDVIEHPEFDGKMREALSRLRMDQWRSPKDLARVVGMVAPDLEGEIPKRTARQQGQQKHEPTPEQRARSLVNRSTLAQTAPSRSTSSGRAKEYSEEDKTMAAQLDMSVEEFVALGQDSNGVAYRKYQQQLAKNGKR